MRDLRIVAGAVFGAAVLGFLMWLVVQSVNGHPVPCDSRTLVVFVLSLGLALSAAFLGGSATARGHLPGVQLQNFAKLRPITFAATGGLAVFVIALVIANATYARKGCKDEAPDGVSYNIPAPTKLRSAIALVAKDAGRDERLVECTDEVLARMVRPGPVQGATHAEVIRLLGVRLEGADTVKLQVTPQEGGIYEVRCV